MTQFTAELTGEAATLARTHGELLEHLSRTPRSELEQSVTGIGRIETEAGASRIGDRNTARFQDEAQALLRRRGLLVAWRSEVDAFFQKVDPAVEAQLYPADAPRRIVVQIYGREIAVQREKLWSRFNRAGMRVPLDLEGATDTERFLATLFGEPDDRRSAPALLDAA